MPPQARKTATAVPPDVLVKPTKCPVTQKATGGKWRKAQRQPTASELRDSANGTKHTNALSGRQNRKHDAKNRREVMPIWSRWLQSPMPQPKATCAIEQGRGWVPESFEFHAPTRVQVRFDIIQFPSAEGARNYSRSGLQLKNPGLIAVCCCPTLVLRGTRHLWPSGG